MFCKNKEIDELYLQAQEPILRLVKKVKEELEKKEVNLEKAIYIIFLYFNYLNLNHKPFLQEVLKVFFDRTREEYGNMDDGFFQGLEVRLLANGGHIKAKDAVGLYAGTLGNMAEYWRNYIEHGKIQLRGTDKNYQRMVMVLEFLRAHMNEFRIEKFKGTSLTDEEIEILPHKDESTRATSNSYAMAVHFKELRNTPEDFLRDCCSESVLCIKDAHKKWYEPIADEIFSKLNEGEGVLNFNPEFDYKNPDTNYVGLGIHEEDDVLWITIRYRRK
ncbi:MAG: hypothetical protein PHP03_01555 [Candidatus Pacebacteria bacterium]|nr:hypothetical protein [Candidatus Paceibacterota bacterium]